MIEFVEFATKHRETLFVVDAVACLFIALSGGFLMATVARVSDRRAAIGMPWPRGLDLILRSALGLGVAACFMVPAQYWAGKVHFVLIEEVVTHTALAVLGVVTVVYRRPLFGPYSA